MADLPFRTSETYTTEDGVTVAYIPGTTDGMTSSERDFVDMTARQLAFQLGNWQSDIRSALKDKGSLFNRTKYVSSDNPYKQMETAKQAMSDDDIVSAAAELTEGLTFQGVQWESEEPDESDMFNQMAAEQDLDTLVRQMHRELFATSQVVIAMWWETEELKVRGKSEKGNSRRLSRTVSYPKRITVLDSSRIVPVGMLQFGQERLAWIGTKDELDLYNRVASGQLEDEVMRRFYDGHYRPTKEEQDEFTAYGINSEHLILLKEDLVRRHTLTRPDYQRFADIRLKSVFRTLDLKQQQMEADRVMLVGAANYILLVKKGSDKDPAYQEEVDALREGFKYQAKLPVIFSDHRLEIEIITPDQDYTLDESKYGVLNGIITARVLDTLGIASSGARSGSASEELSQSRSIARSLENRRHQLARFLERELAKAVVKKNPEFKRAPSLRFSPNRIQLEDDSGLAASIVALRNSKEISRESILDYFGFDQAVEATRREIEEERYDDIFDTVVPFSAANGAPPSAQGAAGSKGGRPTGGGRPSANPAKAPARTNKNTSKTGGSK